MQCPNCQTELTEGAAFCGNCGAAVPAQPSEPVAQPTEPIAQPTTPMPQAASQPPAYDAAAYAQQFAQPTAPPQYMEQPHYAQQAYGQQPPVKKKKTGLIIALVVIGVLVLGGCGVGAFLAYNAYVGDRDPVEAPPGDATGTTPSVVTGYASAEEAVMAELEAAGYGDWVYQLYDETEGQATYWAGPPSSEWVEEIIVARGSDGSWSVTEVNGLDFGGDVSEGSLTPMDEAIAVVDGHLLAIFEDRGDDAHEFTVDPFASDGASAMVSNGDFSGWEIIDATEQSDGTFWVKTTQTWTWGTEQWEFWVVPTELGYRIADLRAW